MKRGRRLVAVHVLCTRAANQRRASSEFGLHWYELRSCVCVSPVVAVVSRLVLAALSVCTRTRQRVCVGAICLHTEAHTARFSHIVFARTEHTEHVHALVCVFVWVCVCVCACPKPPRNSVNSVVSISSTQYIITRQCKRSRASVCVCEVLFANARSSHEIIMVATACAAGVFCFRVYARMRTQVCLFERKFWFISSRAHPSPSVSPAPLDSFNVSFFSCAVLILPIAVRVPFTQFLI